MTILITGGTGKTGSRVAHRLTELGQPFRAVTRHSEPRFDWYDDSTWEGALTGCTSAYVTFQPDIGLPGADRHPRCVRPARRRPRLHASGAPVRPR